MYIIWTAFSRIPCRKTYFIFYRTLNFKLIQTPFSILPPLIDILIYLNMRRWWINLLWKKKTGFDCFTKNTSIKYIWQSHQTLFLLFTAQTTALFASTNVWLCVSDIEPFHLYSSIINFFSRLTLKLYPNFFLSAPSHKLHLTCPFLPKGLARSRCQTYWIIFLIP